MKAPKIACLLLALAFAPLASVSAVDVGGAIYSLTEVSNGSPQFGETGRLTLWLGADLGENTDFYLQANKIFYEAAGDGLDPTVGQVLPQAAQPALERMDRTMSFPADRDGGHAWLLRGAGQPTCLTVGHPTKQGKDQ